MLRAIIKKFKICILPVIEGVALGFTLGYFELNLSFIFIALIAYLGLRILGRTLLQNIASVVCIYTGLCIATHIHWGYTSSIKDSVLANIDVLYVALMTIISLYLAPIIVKKFDFGAAKKTFSSIGAGILSAVICFIPANTSFLITAPVLFSLVVGFWSKNKIQYLIYGLSYCTAVFVMFLNGLKFLQYNIYESVNLYWPMLLLMTITAMVPQVSVIINPYPSPLTEFMKGDKPKKIKEHFLFKKDYDVYCVNCGSKVKASNNNCVNCGNKL